MDRKLLKQIINPIDSYSKSVDCDISYVKPFLEALSFDTQFDMIPDYQRGNNIWNRAQQISFLENVYRGIVEKPMILVNIPFYLKSEEQFKKENVVVTETRNTCIDGLQRLTAILDFIDGKIRLFNNQVGYEELTTSLTVFRNITVANFRVYQIVDKKQLLQYYYDFNFGGTHHSIDERKKIEKMIADLS